MIIGELKEKTAGLLALNKNILKAFEPRKNVLDANIKYWLKNEEIIQLKKGVYILKEKYDKEPNKNLYLEYLAGQMVQPSYLSVEYVLAKYQILSEPARAITSITTKTTREIINNAGSFRYYSITEKLFNGYEVKYFFGAPVFEASKSKALFDYLYLRFIKNEPINSESIDNLRLNWENIGNKEFFKACSYLKFTNSRRLKEIFNLIKAKYYA
ncbi:hypothetical protein KKA96_01980 [Patescibacteria group bacterium]|nr:hypothetical protein [Patescibacteria group bacterium]MBU4141825.1 hypothetical protein [Patescibacteria group bacterium]